MSRPRLLVHIGVPKSATTSLQFGTFPSHPDIRYLGKPFYDEGFGYEGSLATAELSDSLWKQDELEFDPALARQRFDRGIRPRLGGETLAVLSEEGLSHAGATDRFLIARRLSELCKDVECSILLTVREQKSALFSLQQWYFARRLVSSSFEAWISWCRSYSSYYGRHNDFPLREYRYARLVETYAGLFGRERVLVLPMEMLAREPAAFFARLEDFAGIRRFWGTPDCPPMPVENRSPGRLGIRYQRLVKGMRHLGERLRGAPGMPSEALEEAGIHGGVMRLLARIDTPMRPMSAETAAWLDDYYRADNARLAALAGLDLAHYGYVC
jgi:hypothetical protein